MRRPSVKELRQRKLALLRTLEIVLGWRGIREAQHRALTEAKSICRLLHDGEALAQFSNRESEYYRATGRYDAAFQAAQRARRAAQQARRAARQTGGRAGRLLPLQAGSPSSLVSSLVNLGEARRHQGRYAEALRYHRKALAVSERSRNPANRILSLNNLGNVFLSKGDYDDALRCYDWCLPLCRKLNRKHSMAVVLSNTGLVYWYKAQYDRALRCHEESLVLQQEIGNEYGIAVSFTNLGNTRCVLGEYEAAADFFQRSLFMSNRIGERHVASSALNNLGVVEQYLGNYPASFSYQQQALAVRRDIGDRYGVSTSLNDIGVLYSLMGNPEAALAMLLEALPIRESLGNPRGLALTLNALGIAQFELRRFSEATDSLLRSVTHCKAAEMPSLSVFNHSYLSRTALERGQPDDARRFLADALTLTKTAALDTEYEASAFFNLYLSAKKLNADDAAPCLEKAYRSITAQAEKIVSLQTRATFTAPDSLYAHIAAAWRQMQKGL